VFPISRSKVLINEIINYIKRWELLLLLASIFYLLIVYYFNNENISLYEIFLFILDFSLQILLLLFLLFTIKNIIKRDNFKTKFKNYIAAFCNITIIVTVFAERIRIIELVFYYYPFTGGFFSNITPFLSVAIAWSIIITFVIVIFLVNKIKFKEWPVL
jgi:hypothetical protein